MRTVCPQLYEQGEMRAITCTRCRTGWNRATQRCDVETGAEHFPLVPESDAPSCFLQDVCQHQRQALPGLCVVRSRGMVCESALSASGMSLDDICLHPQAFNADFMMTAEEWAAEQARK